MVRAIFFIATIIESVILTCSAVSLAYFFKLDPIILLSCAVGYCVAAKNSIRRQLDE